MSLLETNIPDRSSKKLLDLNFLELSNSETLHSLFERQVKKFPNNIAVQYQDVRFTYAELNCRANKLAHYLLANYDIKSGMLIALCLNKNEYMIIAILAVLKVGGAYIPIDQAYPISRINYVLEDSSANLLLIDDINKIKCGSNITKIIINDKIFNDTLLLQSTNNPNMTTCRNDLAYVIYTSGTTGTPKGVLSTHFNIVRLFNVTNKWYKFSEKDVWCLFHSYVFDFSVWEMWGALLYGGKLLIPSYEQNQDFNLFYELCKQQQVSVLNQTPSAFYQFLDVAVNKMEKLTNLKFVILGGEALNIQQLRPWFEYYGFDHPKLINMYGITETTVHVTYKLINEESLNRSCIGEVLSDLVAYVLTMNLEIVPIGGIGELYIGGEGVARGYLNREDLTAERFIHNPYQTNEEKLGGRNARLFRTGDLVKWLDSGELEYIGRNDFQVKIRGYRIELGEIESILSSYKDIKQSVVIVKERSDSVSSKYLVGYYVSDTKLDEKEIISYLRNKLPEYMVPCMLMHLHTLPLTINGKLDRKLLPDYFVEKQNYLQPQTEITKKVAKLWSSILKQPLQAIGLKDNFFEIGGDSLLAMEFIQKLNKEFNVTIPLRIFFNEPVLEEISHYLVNKTALSQPKKETIIARSDVKSFPLSFSQEQIFLHLQTLNQPIYNEQFAITIYENIDTKKLELSINKLVETHSILRSSVQRYQDQILQSILPFEPFTLNMIDLKNLSPDRREEEFFRLANLEARRNFDLRNTKLIRFLLFKLDDELFKLVIVVHHLVIDGISIYNIILPELIQTYKAYSNNIPLGVVKSQLQYSDYVMWQRKLYDSANHTEDKNYWRSKLDNLPLANLLTVDHSQNNYDNKGAYEVLAFSSELTQALKILTQKEKTTIFTTLLSIVSIILYRYTGETDIVVGSVVSDRSEMSLQGLVGNFLNTIIFRNDLSGDNTFKTLLQKIHRTTIESYEHLSFPFQHVMQLIKGRQANNSKIPFQVALVMEPRLPENELSWSISQLEIHTETTKFDLTIELEERFDKIIGRIEYNTNLFDKAYIRRFIDNFLTISHSIISHPNKSLHELQLLSLNEYDKIINQWNSTSKYLSSSETIHSLFEKQVRNAFENIAVTDRKESITYQALNERANQLAHFLTENYKITPRTLVVICLNRSIDTIVAILAVLKAGCAYIPIELDHSDERIGYIMQDTQSNIILTNILHENRLENVVSNLRIPNKDTRQINILAIDREFILCQLKLQSLNNLQHIAACNNDLAYIMYTSGTTGVPKGVMLEHRAIVNYINNVKDNILINPGSRVDFSTSIGFDLTITTTLCALCHGLQVIVYQGQLQDLDSYKSYLINNKINIIKMVPSYLNMLVDFLSKTEINRIIVGGEKLDQNVISKIRNLYHDTDLIIYDEYGPTETAVGACYNEVYPNRSCSIGRPYNNYKVYVLTMNLEIVPIGGIGELYIGGEGVARGYLNREDLTAERFIHNPYQTNEEKLGCRNARLFRTGDLVKWLDSGELEYIGRNDFQVKIRGYRIELGEIESILSSYKDIKQSVVIVKERSDSVSSKYLVGYYVSDTKLDEKEIISYLRNKLPEYMVPCMLMHLHTLPLTINGKLDRKLLPDSELYNNESFVPPNNNFEQSMCYRWADLLSLPREKVGICDDFFSLGGDSILAMKLVSNLQGDLNKNITVADLFKYSTVEKLLKFLEEIAEITRNEAVIYSEEWKF